MKSAHRHACERLAKELVEPDALRIWQLTRRWHQTQQTARVANQPPPPQTDQQTHADDHDTANQGTIPNQVSIWRPTRNAHGQWIYQRPKPGLFGDHFSAVPEFALEKPVNTRRICFFGESVAAGYLFAPVITPARLLEDTLNQGRPKPEFEVIDLAKTNETLEPLLDTFRQSLVLQPDVAVLFVGNNWNLLEAPQQSAYYPSASARRGFADSMTTDDLLGPIERAAKTRMAKASRVLGQIEALAQAAQVHLVIIVPEVNLWDWHDCQPVSWLPGEGTAEWYRRLTQAHAALARGNYQAALADGQAMTELDGATNPISFRIQALAHRHLGNQEACRRACRLEVDAGQYAAQCYIGSPRIAPLEQAILRRFAQRGDHGLVDLPEVFAKHFPGEIPGKRWFVDYCHLSIEGMELAMTATANHLLHYFQSQPMADQPQKQTTLPTNGQATALLGAAIHTAHRLCSPVSKQALLVHWCRQSVDLTPQAIDMMIAYVDAHTTRGPVILSQGQQSNLAMDVPLTPQHGWGWTHFDVQFILAIRQVLEQQAPETLTRLDQLLSDRLAIGYEDTELLPSGYFLWEPVARPLTDVMNTGTQPAFFRATWPETQLALVCSAAHTIQLSLCARLAVEEPADAHARLRLAVNGEDAGWLPLSTGWQNQDFRLPGNLIQPGINQLTLGWPLPHREGRAALRAARSRLAQGFPGDIHPIFGEVFSLNARLVDD